MAILEQEISATKKKKLELKKNGFRDEQGAISLLNEIALEDLLKKSLRVTEDCFKFLFFRSLMKSTKINRFALA